jgi:hypothetical protein
MKQMTCAQMGGPATCDAVITGNSAPEMITNGTAHVMAAHPDVAESMKTMPKETMDKWTSEFQAKWDAAPDM